MTSTVSIVTARADAVLRVPSAALRFVPSDALLQEFGAATVNNEADNRGQRRVQFIWELANGRLERIPVRVGVSDGTQVEVIGDGLKEGASIITGVARSEKTAAAAPAASGSPLVPQMPRRAGGSTGANTGGTARQAR
jgi:HlyD family secretion protein